MISIPETVTCVLTSCGRWDLLTITLDTFLEHHRPARFVIVEDSADEGIAARIRARYPQIEVLLNAPRIGQHRAVDRAYTLVDTPYVLHLEDDWHFLGPAGIGAAISLVDSDHSISSVSFRRFDTLKWRQRILGQRFCFGDGSYVGMARAHSEWHGFSFNPSLLRHTLWVENGPYSHYPNERAISRAMKEQGKQVVFQLPGVAFHIGSGRSVYDPSRSSENRRISGAWRAKGSTERSR